MRVIPFTGRFLGGDYADAWNEWSESGDAEAWDAVVGDGLVAG